MSTPVPTVVQQEEVDRLWFGGGLLTFKVTSGQSDNALILIEHVASRGKTTPLHLHEGHDETAYLLEGELLLYLDGVESRAAAGDCVHLPRGRPHAFLVTSEIARSLWVVTPGGAMETFYRQAGEVATTSTLPSATADFARIRAVGEETGAMTFIGPPPFPRAAGS